MVHVLRSDEEGQRLCSARTHAHTHTHTKQHEAKNEKRPTETNDESTALHFLVLWDT